MKVTYLDQNHWIELSKAAYGIKSYPGTPGVLEALRQARISGRACFPISYAHYIETRKHGEAERRHRLATFMLELSAGVTVAPPPVVIRHEIEVTLGHCFPGRVVPEPFQLLGVGLAHAAADKDWDVSLEWPPGADTLPALLRAVVDGCFRATAELAVLSGVSQVGERREWGPLTSLTVEHQFKAVLEQFRGAAARYSPDELEREIYATNLSDIANELQEALARHRISLAEFAQLGELRRRAFLEDMPWQRAEMHLKRQWAKNAALPPHDSDLIDWSFLSLAVSYYDIVVTEKQMANLFSRGFNTRATMVSQRSQLPELVA